MKTPEEIADAMGYPAQDDDPMIAQGLASRDVLHDTFRATVIAAIEADRAQRSPIQVAVIEWPDEVADPSVFLALSIEALHVKVRTAIEAHFAATVPEHAPEPREWVEGDGRNEPDFAKWHGTLHECDGTPWVTFTEQEVSV